jgi:hypothetical protein
MFLSIVFQDLVVSLQRNKEKVYNPVLVERRSKDLKTIRNMETKRTNETIEMLQYQLKRYKALRKGATCQMLQFKLHKLMEQQANER